VGQEAASAGRIWRLPASEIEPLVTRRLVAAVRDRSWVLDQAPQSCASVAERQASLGRAAELSSRLESADSKGKRGLLLALVSRIVLEGEHLAILMRTRVLLSGAADVAADVRGSSNIHPPADAIAEIRAPFVLARRGSETKLIILGESRPAPEPDRVLVKAVAQAHRWWRDLQQQRYRTIRELARAYDTDERYAARIIPLAFLPGELTTAILNGLQPVELSLVQLLNP
jgi:site-specific DNA recombinase